MTNITEIAQANTEALRSTDYPGRGIVLGLSPSGKELVQIYWTMGRSKNSKNRILVKEDGIVKTKPHDMALEMQKAELLIYNASAQFGGTHIVSNGRQTDTAAEYLMAGKSFEDAMRTWEFENDPPIYTSRITGVSALREDKSYLLSLSIIKAYGQNPDLLSHHFFSYGKVCEGTGACIHTYSQDKTCYHFEGEPYFVSVCDSVEENAQMYWNILDPEKRVGLYVKHIDIASGEFTDKVISYI